ncbi:PQQ-binding-like beta-propeller repeat protein [Streptomyces sp. NPDC003036]|uniref:outer membrane protein assembly factor BamB family protein n=1 Tax=Streptomyces sp. NPDC003036 TaxID=3154442 RepID=UPI0033AF91AF
MGVLIVGGVLLGIVIGLAFMFMGNSGYMPWFSLKPVWEAPPEREDSGRGNGSFPMGETLIRSRVDGVAAFDLGTGAKRWEYLVPRRSDVCDVTEPDGSVALVSFGVEGSTEYGDLEPGKGCTGVIALDLTNGRELWRTTRVPASNGLDDAYGLTAVGGGLGVVLDGDDRPLMGIAVPGSHALRAYDLRTGTARWQAAMPKGCVPGQVTVAPKQVLAAVHCDGEVKLAAFDPADGTARWTVPLDARRGVEAAAVGFMSADPLVVSVQDEDDSGVRAMLAFGPDGRLQSRIDDVGDHGNIARAIVSDGRLITLALYRGKQSTLERLVAFDLATGRELWREDLGGGLEVDDLEVKGDRVMVVATSRKSDDRFFVFDAATGDEEEDRGIRGGWGSATLYAYKDRFIAVRWGAGEPPVMAYERW